MFPDQAVQSALDVNASIMVPIHWSVFNLGRTPWKQSIHRVDKIVAERKVRLDVPGMDEKYTPQIWRTDKWGKSVK